MNIEEGEEAPEDWLRTQRRKNMDELNEVRDKNASCSNEKVYDYSYLVRVLVVYCN